MISHCVAQVLKLLNIHFSLNWWVMDNNWQKRERANIKRKNTRWTQWKQGQNIRELGMMVWLVKASDRPVLGVVSVDFKIFKNQKVAQNNEYKYAFYFLKKRHTHLHMFPISCYRWDLESMTSPIGMNSISDLIMVSQHHFLLKGPRVFWKNCCFQVWDRKYLI